MLQASRSHDPAEVAAALERAFARPELTPQEPSPLERGLERLFAALPNFDADPAAAWTLLWVVAIVVALACAWVLVRVLSLSGRRRAAEAEAEVGAPAIDVEARLADLRARAEAARRAGDATLALRLGFFALLVALSRRGDLELRDAWTHREMLERGRPSAPIREALEPLLGELDAMLFGGRGVSAEDLQRFDALSAGLLARGEGGAS